MSDLFLFGHIFTLSICKIVEAHPALRDQFEHKWPVRVLISTTLTNIKTNSKRSERYNCLSTILLIILVLLECSSEDEEDIQEDNPRASRMHEAQPGTLKRGRFSE